MTTMFLSLIACAALGGHGGQPDPARMDAIWAEANNRVADQVDVWFDDGDYPKVIQLLKMHTEMFPADYDIATNLGWMQENVQDYPAAIKTYERFRERNPHDPDAALALAEFYFRQKRYKDVIPLMEPAIVGKPHPNAFRMLAHSYEKLGDLKNSERVWKLYIARAPSDLTAQANLRRVEKKLQGS